VLVEHNSRGWFYIIFKSPSLFSSLHRVSENSQNCFWHNFVKFSPTLIIFGTKMAKTILLCMVHSFTISPYLCQRTTMWNTDVPNCYITRYVAIICIRWLTFSSLIRQRERGFNNLEVWNILCWKQQITKQLADEFKTHLIDEWMHLISWSLILISAIGIAFGPLQSTLWHKFLFASELLYKHNSVK